MSSSDSEAEMFDFSLLRAEEPEDPPPPPPTTETYTSALTPPTFPDLTIRLVGHNPLWGHHLWNGARVVSAYFEKSPELVKGKTIFELGAGAGLPSLVAAKLGAKKVVVTDYPDEDLVKNLWWNVEHNEVGSLKEDGEPAPNSTVVAAGYLWGAGAEPMLHHIAPDAGFDLLILADLLFNHSEHMKLLDTVRRTLKRTRDAQALVFFTPYRPWLFEKDMSFFAISEEGGFSVEKVLEEKMEKVMFEKDRGDEEVRRTVYGYVLKWKENELDLA
jgi:nicotinamide N-methyltransferase